MVKVALEIKATLENVEKLYTVEKEHVWFLKLKCSSCGEESDKWHDLCESETVDSRNAKSEVNFLMKCKLCSRENSVAIVEDSSKTYTLEDAERFKQIIIFEFRGFEPVDFSPRGGWVVKSEGGVTFEDVDLTEKLWADYDERNNQSVGIYELESRFVKVK